MNVDKKAVFHLVLGFLPGNLGAAARMVEGAVTSGKSKKAKVLDTAVAGMAALKELSVVSQDAKFIEAVGKANDALVAAANIAQQIADAQVSSAAGPDGQP